MALREIAAHFGFTFDAAKLSQIDKGVSGVKKHTEDSTASVAGFAEGLRGVIGALTAGVFVEFANHIKEQAAQLQDLTEQTGLGTDELQAWSLAAELGGASAQDFTNGLRKLSKELATGVDESGQQSKLFKQLHIDTKNADGSVRDLSSVLPDIAEKFKGLKSGAERSALAQQIFGRSGTKLVPILSQGAAGVAQLKKQLDDLGGGFSKEAIENADAYDDALIKLNYSFFGMKSLLATSVFPMITDLVTTVTKGVVQFKDWIKTTTLLENGIKVLALTIGRSLLVALAPFILPGLQFLAIFLAIDDLLGFLDGKDSEIAHILDKWFGDGTADAVRNWCNDAKAAVANWVHDVFTGQLIDDALNGRFKGGFIGGMLTFLMLGIGEMISGFATLRAGVTLELSQIQLTFAQVVQSLEKTWQAFVQGLHLPDFAEKALGGQGGTPVADSKVAALQAQVFANAVATQAAAFASAANVGGGRGGNAAQDPTTTFKVANVPLKPGVGATQNFVEVKPNITVTVPLGTSAEQARYIARNVGDAVGNERRAALQSLEQR